MKPPEAMQDPGRMQRFVVSAEDAGQRLDSYLAARLPELSRTRIQELMNAARVRLNGVQAKRAHRVAASDVVEIEVVPRPALEALPEAIPLDVLYEDADLLVVNKPAGMTVHAGAGAASGTLVNALLHRLGALSSVGGPLRPGIVHRLDRGTSGVLIVARHDLAHRHLAEEFRARRVRKTYLALVHGRLRPDHGFIGLPIARDLRRRTRMTTQRPEGREARTEWRVLAHLNGFTLVEVTLHTGRTHQIRVHFSALRHPIVGDTLYGAPRHVRIEKETLPPLGRNFLHAARIAFTHPRRPETIEARAPLPAELRAYLRGLAGALKLDANVIDAALRAYI